MKEDIIRFIKSKEYKYLKEVGQGGTGRTILIKDETINERFVCKKYSPYFSECKTKYYEHFVNEIKILYKINHPNIVRVFSYHLYPEHTTGYILMEYIEGCNIDEYIKANPKAINDIFVQTISGFKYLEDNGIMHRDVRPGNILVSTDGIPKIIDFGFGKTTQETIDCTKSVSLNWAYSTPEEFINNIYDHKTEVYFVGKLFERLIGDNNISQLFKYSVVLESMILPNPDNRISSFQEVVRNVASENSLLVKFSEEEKNIYSNMADSFTCVCTKMYEDTKYVEDLEIITAKISDLLQKSILETYLQSNKDLISCFVSGSFRYITRAVVHVNQVERFYEWWNQLSKDRKIIVLNNLWTRFDNIERKMDDELPF